MLYIVNKIHLLNQKKKKDSFIFVLELMIIFGIVIEF